MSMRDCIGYKNNGRAVPPTMSATVTINVSLLFAFLDPIVTLNHSPWLSRFEPGACILDESYETLRQFPNAFCLTPLNGFCGDELRTYANGRGASQNKIGRRLLIHASCGNQGNLWQRSLQCFDVTLAANLRAGK